MDSEKNQEQLEKDSTASTEQSENKDKISYEDLEKSYKYTQSELSKSTEKLSRLEKQGMEIDEVKQKAELTEKAEKIRGEEEVFNTFKSNFSTLSETQLKSIRDLQTIDPTKTFEDVAKSYGMLDEAQLERSKNNKQIMGNSIGVKGKEKEEVTISDKARRIHNIKTPEKLAELKENFSL